MGSQSFAGCHRPTIESTPAYCSENRICTIETRARQPRGALRWSRGGLSRPAATRQDVIAPTSNPRWPSPKARSRCPFCHCEPEPPRRIRLRSRLGIEAERVRHVEYSRQPLLLIPAQPATDEYSVFSHVLSPSHDVVIIVPCSMNGHGYNTSKVGSGCRCERRTEDLTIGFSS